MIKKLFFVVLFLVFILKSEAQIDTSFWFVAPKVPSAIGVNSVSLQIGCYTQAATVYVRQPANTSGVNFTITLAANTSTVIDLTSSQALITSTLANAADNKGLYISSTDLVSVNYIISSNVGNESISLKGRSAVGDDFYTPFPNSINSIPTASAFVTNSIVPGNVGFDIVATEPGLTTLVITPRANLVGPRVKNNTFVTTLNQGQTFSCQESLRNTRKPISVVTSNFNGDAFPDMAIVDNPNSLVFIFIGNGTGGFTEVGNYPVGLNPRKIIANDVNSDLKQDLIITNAGSNDISVILGNGNGTFGATNSYTVNGIYPVSIACDDINADSKLDVIVTNSVSNDVSVLNGNGLGTFTFSANYAVGTWPTDIGISDINNDGRKDFVVTIDGTFNDVHIWLGSLPIGTFSFSPTYTFNTVTDPQELVIADFNNDGLEDLAVASLGGAAGPQVRVFRSFINAGNVTFTSAGNNYTVGNVPSDIIATNVNGDAFIDLVVTNFSDNSVSVLAGISGTTATFSTPYNFNMVNGLSPSSIAVGDFNGDLKNDFVTTNFDSNDFSILFGTGATTLSPGVSHTFGYTQSYPSELAGSIVSADKKIAITLNGAIGNATSCPSFYTDQITNSSKIGKDYVIHKSNTSNDVVYILATLNSTSLSITSGATTNWLINSGETYTVNTSANNLTYIKTDKPVYVFNLAGNGCKLGGAQIAPAYCAGSYTAGFTRTSSDSLYLDVYIRNGYQNTFTLMINSIPNLIPASSFTFVPGSSNNLVGARLYFNTSTMPVGAYCILKNTQDLFGFSVQNSSNARGNSFSQYTNFHSDAFVIANSAPTATICSNTPFTLNGQIGGGPITGVWSSNGYGTLSGGSTQVINNVYTPNINDTSLAIIPTPTPAVFGGMVKFVLTSTGVCPNTSDTFLVYVKQQPLVTAGSSSIICSNTPTVYLSGNVFGSSTQGIWSVLSPGNGTFVPGVNTFTPTYLLSNADTALAQLQFVLTSTNNGFCSAVSNTVTITINHAPLVTSSIVKPLLRCANNSTVHLTGIVSGTTTSTGRWNTLGTGFFVPNQLSLICDYVPSALDVASGSLWLKLTSTNNLQCLPVIDSVNVIFTQPAFVTAGVDLNSCKNNPVVPLSAIITGTASTSGIWYGGAGTFTASNTSLTTTYIATPAETSAGFVTLTFSTTNNGICAGALDQIRIDFQDKPTGNFTVNAVCLNQATIFTDHSLNPSSLGSLSGWQWHMGDGATSNALNPIYTYSTAGNYTAQLVVNNNFNCYDTVYRPVTVYALPTASFAIERLCTGSAQLINFIDLSTISPPASIPSTGYYWDFGGAGFSTSKDTSLIFPSQGFYNISHQITSINGCKSSISQTVNITPKPVAKFFYINNTTLSLGANISFVDSSISAAAWHWDFGNGLTSTIQNPATTYSANGTYTVSLTITDQFGCQSSYFSVIKITSIAAEITQLIPNMITPNNDGKNDVWRLDFINVYFPAAEIEIYNRWGDRLFKSVGYDNAWDGSYLGSPLPVGVYYYTIKLNDGKDSNVNKGTVTILK